MRDFNIELESAFGSLGVPAPAELVEDRSGNHLECNEIIAKYGGQHWRELSPKEVALDADSLWFLSPEGFQFLLPAFLKAAVDAYEGVDLVPVTLVHLCLEPEDSSLKSSYHRRLAILTSAQREAYRDFLLRMMTFHKNDFDPGELEKALDSMDG